MVLHWLLIGVYSWFIGVLSVVILWLIDGLLLGINGYTWLLISNQPPSITGEMRVIEISINYKVPQGGDNGLRPMAKNGE